MKTALTIGGSDPSGGAGIQADLKTFSVLKVYGMTAITAITAQNTMGVKHWLALEAELVRQQIEAVVGDLPVDACKTGMLANVQIVNAVADCISGNKIQPYVCDPGLATKSGFKLLTDEALETMRSRLFPLAAVVTPNLRESARLSGSEPGAVTSIPQAKEAARKIAGQGARAVLIKGIEQGEQMVDLFFDGKEFLEFAEKTQPKEKTHGSGSVFGAAITAGLANRMSLVEAIDQAKQVVTMAIQYSDGQGRGRAPVNVLAFAPKKK